MALLDRMRKRLEDAERPAPLSIAPRAPSQLHSRALPNQDGLTFGWDVNGRALIVDVIGHRYAPALLYFDQPGEPRQRMMLHWVPINTAIVLDDFWELCGMGHIYQAGTLTPAALFREVE